MPALKGKVAAEYLAVALLLSQAGRLTC
jgi:hypothetical protein